MCLLNTAQAATRGSYSMPLNVVLEFFARAPVLDCLSRAI
jgi:hypothetical protein